MGRLVAMVTAVALASGCTSYKGSKDTASAGGGLILGTVLIGGAIADKNDDVDAGEAATVMVPLILIGLGLAVLGLGGMAANPNEETEIKHIGTPQPPPPVDPVALRMAEEDRRRRAAWDMTQQARAAAFQNDCQRVAYLAARVVEVDRPTFDNVFSRDPYIVRCAPKPPQDPPPAIPIPPLDPKIPPPPSEAAP